MPNLKPLRDYSEHEVVNLFAISGASLPINKGSIVRIATGWHSALAPQLMAGTIGQVVANTVSQRWNVQALASVINNTGGGDAFGITLLDVRETDENSNQLIYQPQSQWERSCVLSGQACPILTRGIVHYSGVDGNPAGGAKLYVTGGNGTIANGLTTFVVPGDNAVARALGPKDSQGFVLVKFDFTN